MKKYIFNKMEALDDFEYAYSPICKEHVRFEQQNGCVANYKEESPEEFAYVSVITKEKIAAGAKVSVKCSFGKFGAPLLVFSNDLSSNDDGSKLYGLHFEVVAYENGCNIWHIVPDPSNIVRPIKTKKIAFAEFPIQENEMIDIVVQFEKGRIVSAINGHKILCENEDIPEEFYVGFTGCEGPNRFYEMVIE